MSTYVDINITKAKLMSEMAKAHKNVLVGVLSVGKIFTESNTNTFPNSIQHMIPHAPIDLNIRRCCWEPLLTANADAFKSVCFMSWGVFLIYNAKIKI